MANRVTGMYSGMDTESLIQDLMNTKRKKVESMNKKKTKMEWKQEAWNDLNTKIKTFYSKTVNNMRWTTSYAKKATSVSNSNAVSVITGEKAMNSVQKLSIKQLASSGYLTGAKVEASDGSEVKASSLVSSLTFGTGEDAKKFSGTGSFNVTANGTTTKIDINADTTISDVVSQLNAAGVSANFDEKNGRLFIGAKTSGKDADFTVTANDANGNVALSVLGINASVSDSVKAEYEKVASYASYIGATDSDTIDNIIAAGSNSDVYKRLMSMAKVNYTSEVNAKSAEVSAKKTEISDLEKKIEELKAEKDNDTLTEEDKAKVAEELAAKEAELETKKTDFENSGLEAELEEMQANLNAGAYSTDAMNKAAKSLTDQINYAQSFNPSDDSMVNADSKKLDGDDAIIELNEVEFRSSTNNVEVNGLTFTCKAVAEDITVTTQEDTDGIYDMIKGFLKEYNTLINEMDSLYNAESTKLEPLTDEEKDAVSDTEAEKLEKKVRDSVLRRDDDLGTIFNGLKEIMARGIEVNGEMMYLSNFGISTPSYLETKAGERNAYHIDGDSDDSLTSGNADKLKGMIATDSETVIAFFSQLGKDLNTKLSQLSATSEYQTYGTFYSDKRMKTEMSDYEKQIAKAEEKLQDEEDKLYDKFSAMEVALSKINSKNSYISSLFS